MESTTTTTQGPIRIQIKADQVRPGDRVELLSGKTAVVADTHEGVIDPSLIYIHLVGGRTLDASAYSLVTVVR